ncbi:MAG TPA: hypothetical protein VLN56_05165, partial [Gammaproteobacteria bacterium]|nr:hypothetical protein [Gammaproteobacteria bacterium]
HCFKYQKTRHLAGFLIIFDFTNNHTIHFVERNYEYYADKRKVLMLFEDHNIEQYDSAGIPALHPQQAPCSISLTLIAWP